MNTSTPLDIVMIDPTTNTISGSFTGPLTGSNIGLHPLLNRLYTANTSSLSVGVYIAPKRILYEL